MNGSFKKSGEPKKGSSPWKPPFESLIFKSVGDCEVQFTCLYELAYIKEAFMCGFWETSDDLYGVAVRTLKLWIALWKVADEHCRDLNACIFCWGWYLASWVVEKT